MRELQIKGRENGPYLVAGRAEYVDADGQAQTTQGTRLSLCRCGGSAKKPLCDGTHRKIEFRAPAVELTVVE
jgi:CDGSH-type Zn-finger protein